MIVIGLDIGSVAAKGVMLDNYAQHQIVIPTGWSPRDAGEQLIYKLLNASGYGRSDIDSIVVTGYGRIAMEQANKAITEIKCHARGIAELFPGVRTIIDIGGQDSKVISINGKGKVVDFAMNDKCAAGTGRFLQVMATAMGIDISEMGSSEDGSQLVNVNSMCTVFAESEIIGLLARGVPKGGIIAGLHQSVGKRVAAMARRVGVKDEIAFTGGVAINAGVRRALAEELGCSVIVPDACQFTGALGAALLAWAS
ncbi:MAG: acyl-CoA dehydratase activase [Syntrophomonadaceae bacterium]|nr:acyl-CoA dehydratase activase [Syntrophomonadaceae bacterium]MDD4549887.1 acyl-CoA dehydratase activase [Syntrophomonadaceae bacterium]